MFKYRTFFILTAFFLGILSKETHSLDFEEDIEDKNCQKAVSQITHKGEVFKNVYILGETAFEEQRPLSINETGFHVLNPFHYQRLAEILYPVFQSNPKGLIIASTVKEADRLVKFFNKTFNQIHFSSYHGAMSDEDMDVITQSAMQDKNPHYIVVVQNAVRLQMFQFPAYIDLNTNNPVKTTIERALLHFANSAVHPDFLLLTSYRKEKITYQQGDAKGNLSELLELINDISPTKKRTSQPRQKTTVQGNGTGAFITRKELLSISSLQKGQLEMFINQLKLEAKKKQEKEKKKKATQNKQKVSYKELEQRVRTAGIITRTRYKKWQQQYPDIPPKPYNHYPEWKSWRHLFGTELISYKKLEKVVRTAGIITRNTHIEDGKNTIQIYPTIQKNTMQNGRVGTSYSELIRSPSEKNMVTVLAILLESSYTVNTISL